MDELDALTQFELEAFSTKQSNEHARHVFSLMTELEKLQAKQEAYENETDLAYLKNRKGYAFVKYLKS